MKQVEKLENIIAKWFEPIPDLPTNGRIWLAHNIWWLILAVVIVSIFGIVYSLSVLLYPVTMPMSAQYGYNVAVSPFVNGWWLTDIVVTLILTVVAVILSAMAINPLRLLRRRGWTLLFIVYLIRIVGTVIGVILSVGLLGFLPAIFFGAIGLAVSGYILFQIRPYFGKRTIPLSR